MGMIGLELYSLAVRSTQSLAINLGVCDCLLYSLAGPGAIR
jgi:hypothetical protein